MSCMMTYYLFYDFCSHFRTVEPTNENIYCDISMLIRAPENVFELTQAVKVQDRPILFPGCRDALCNGG